MILIRFYLIALLCLLTSCASHFGSINLGNIDSKISYKVNGIAIGKSQSTKILGIGGLNKNTLIFDAKQNLYKHTSLEERQILSNVTLDLKRSNYLLFQKTEAYITAEIIDFNTERINQNPTSNYAIIQFNSHALGETVYVQTPKGPTKGTVSSLRYNRIQVISEKYTKSYKYEEIYTMKGKFVYRGHEIEVGKIFKVTGSLIGYGSDEVITATVVAIKSDKCLAHLQTETHQLVVLDGEKTE